MSSIDLADARRFATAYQEHHARAVRVANSVLRDPAAAEDVAQDVFADLWTRRRRFDAARGSLSSYVAMLARCKAIDLHRSQRSRDAALARAGEAELHAGAVDEGPVESVLRAELRDHLLGALDELPASQRAAVLLTSANGFSVPEVARMTGAPLGTAKSRVRLGLRRTRALLECPA